jgi:DNA-binding NarL/FixJ family response regulator
MPKRVAVAGKSPTWRRGISAILDEAGFVAVDRPSLSDWRPGRDGVAVVLDMGMDGAVDELSEFAEEHPHIPVIAALDEIDLAECAAAIRSGAAGIFGESEPVETLVAVLEASLDGRMSLTRDIARSMASRIPVAPAPEAWVTDDEADWLRSLADGDTVADLAERIGYSERETFRTLHDLYLRLGVRNRTEAIIWATRHGILD